MIIGYTTGVFDLFHIGHLNILKNAKSQCDYLIVGISTDEVIERKKGKKPVIPFKERIEIIKNLKIVDEAVKQDKIDELEDLKKYKYNIIFKGSDWKGIEKWIKLEEEFKKLGVKVVFFPYTQTTSSTIIRTFLEKEISKSN